MNPQLKNSSLALSAAITAVCCVLLGVSCGLTPQPRWVKRHVLTEAQKQERANKSMKRSMAETRADSLAKALYDKIRPDQKMQYASNGAPILTWH
jgi:hypothetical protein